MITYEEIRENKDISTYIVKADECLKYMGFTEHSFSHVTRVAETADYILRELDYSARERELAKIAGYMHDIGNIVNRIDHAQSGAVMSFRILDRLGVAPDEIADIIAAIGNHDENTASPVSAIAAALILSDKSDVRYTRVRNRDFATFDIHDRVNFSVKNSKLSFEDDNKKIVLNLTIDTEFCSVMDYFEIFMGRMILCKKAAEYLGIRFKLRINDQSLL